MGHLKTLSLKEIATRLNFKDVRSARRFCEKHNVAIFLSRTPRFWYVIETDFEFARLGQFIAHLKDHYGDRWVDAFEAHADFNVQLLLALPKGNNLKVDFGARIKNHNSIQQGFLDKINNL